MTDSPAVQYVGGGTDRSFAESQRDQASEAAQRRRQGTEYLWLSWYDLRERHPKAFRQLQSKCEALAQGLALRIPLVHDRGLVTNTAIIGRWKPHPGGGSACLRPAGDGFERLALEFGHQPAATAKALLPEIRLGRADDVGDDLFEMDSDGEREKRNRGLGAEACVTRSSALEGARLLHPFLVRSALRISTSPETRAQLEEELKNAEANLSFQQQDAWASCEDAGQRVGAAEAAAWEAQRRLQRLDERASFLETFEKEHEDEFSGSQSS